MPDAVSGACTALNEVPGVPVPHWSAAPDLYPALKRAVEILEQCEGVGSYDLDPMYAALAKAEGRLT